MALPCASGATQDIVVVPLLVEAVGADGTSGGAPKAPINPMLNISNGFENSLFVFIKLSLCDIRSCLY